MGQLVVSTRNKPLPLNRWIMQELRGYATAAQILALHDPVFRPFERGDNRIMVQSFSTDEVLGFRALLRAFLASLDSDDPMIGPVGNVIDALTEELEHRRPQ